MKKFLSVVIAAMITMACTVFPAFATGEATPDAATPDEVATVASIEITKLPDKLVYVGGEDADWDYDSVSLGDIMNGNLEDIEALRAMELKFNLDLTGIEVVATYTDSTTADVPVEELTAKVTNPLTYGEIIDISEKYDESMNEDISYEEYEKLMEDYLKEVEALILRDFIVEVEYKGATDTYTVNISEDLGDYDSTGDYELVSFTMPEKVVYDMANEDEVYIEDWSDESGEYFYYDVMIDTTGMTATLRHKETGEMVTVNGEDISAYFFYDYAESGKLVPGVYDVEATAWTEDGSYVDFTFPITIVDSSQKTDDSSTDKPSTDEPSTDDATSSVSTADTATPDSDNTAIKTGTPSNVTAMLSVVLVMTVGVVLFWYKKRVTE